MGRWNSPSLGQCCRSRTSLQTASQVEWIKRLLAPSQAICKADEGSSRSRVVRATGCQCQSRNRPSQIPAPFDTVQSEGRQIKQCCITYVQYATMHFTDNVRAKMEICMVYCLCLNLGIFINFLLMNYHDLVRQCIANYMYCVYKVPLNFVMKDCDIFKTFWPGNILLVGSDNLPPDSLGSRWRVHLDSNLKNHKSLLQNRFLTRFCPSFYRTLPILHSVNYKQYKVTLHERIQQQGNTNISS